MTNNQGKYPCKAVGNDFLQSAPIKFVSSIILSAPCDVVFKAFEDPLSWPQWFPGIKEVTWTSPKPFGVGTTRIVRLQGLDVYEYFYNWEINRRFTFYAESINSSPFRMFNVLAEDYSLEELPNNTCRFVYTVAIEPACFLRLIWPLARSSLQNQFSGAPIGLERYLSNNISVAREPIAEEKAKPVDINEVSLTEKLLS